MSVLGYILIKMDFLVGTVRFNNDTYLENYLWKKRKEYKGCAYGLDKPLSKDIPEGKYIYIIEMNNDTNKIMGIGKIKNQVVHTNRSRMYSEERRNKFMYKSMHSATREDILEAQPRANTVLKFLENMLFHGSGHFKRGQGCTILPWDRISTAGNNKKIKKKSYRCGTCGMKAKNHTCPGRKIKISLTTKKCRTCNKTKKGHVCAGFKKNLVLENFVRTWFGNLFTHK